MSELDDLDNAALPENQRLRLALKLAVAALNDAPSFRTHFVDAHGRNLSSYKIIPKLEAVLRGVDPS